MALPYRDINVQVSSDSYIFTSPSSPNAPALTIDRPTGDIRLTDGSSLAGKRVSRVTSIAGILGIIQLRLDKYVIVITKIQPVERLKGHMVYKIIATELLPMRERQVHDPDEDRFLLLLKTFIRSGPMYFSYSIDLTNSFQRQAQHGNSTPLWQRADDRFFWNKFVSTDLIEFRTRGGRGHPGPQPSVDAYILPVIFGMLEIHKTTFKKTRLTLVLITRRSRHRGGTRYFSRGIDDEGHVSNYNETEQVVILNDSDSGLGGFAGNADMQSGKLGGSDGREMQILAYVQTRGSVPVYWAEINTLHYTPKLQIRGIDAAFPAAAAHFNEQIRIYGDNYLVNLVNQKGREKRVKDAYEQIVEKLVTAPKERVQADQLTDEKFHTIEPGASKQAFDRLHYVYFDFHSETKGMQMHRAQLLVDRLEEALVAQQYFRAVDMPAGIDGRMEVRNHQTSVVRTNCMDCLDRTNVVQSMLARWTLNRMFIDLGLMQRGTTFKEEDPAFELLYRNLWADNADVVSKSYSGTGAMKTDITRLGTRTKAGAFGDGKVAVSRYFRNNFLDGPRQDAFDLFLGVYTPGTASIGSSLIFADRRPILIQSIPYILGFAVFLVFVGMSSRRLPDAAVWPMRLFILFWFFVAAWCFQFIRSNGMLYVNWPKLNPRPYVAEGYQETISKVRKDPVIGGLVARHERGLSTARYLNAEEGKKRIE
ncbi:putative phosphoinositide phosphatase protein [Phaeoacremonium minimum UCRPA7]|uniref:Putative phosphoinositide phosphatase protein n=1 Tax=Phaeoacremonium minimum (strain UCR-PA7) TaxID=1286976 RepID=R8B9N9_PHAM7|nr:putative phosphoinositide phosphatase protein [Phaeoacremonium minimum UCRPA7]EON96024.1 putative phosphoinositide phosphatase protein [Phaeoacremonium minimum UCRPA7]